MSDTGLFFISDRPYGGMQASVRSRARLIYRCMALSSGQRTGAKQLSSKA